MKRLLFIVASVIFWMLSPQTGDAGGPYDGQWSGSATATTGPCKPAPVTLSVLGKIVTGRATFEREAKDIRGTIAEDGTFGATIGWQPISGRFIQDEFEGTFNSFECSWKIVLKRTK
jgi:hypothetical protein